MRSRDHDEVAVPPMVGGEDLVWTHGEHDTHDRPPALAPHRPLVDFTNDHRCTTRGGASSSRPICPAATADGEHREARRYSRAKVTRPRCGGDLSNGQHYPRETSPASVPSVTIAERVLMPILGLGTWDARGDEAYAAVRAALDVGYRHIDTATSYENEESIGRAARDSGLAREHIFITTKMPPKTPAESGPPSKPASPRWGSTTSTCGSSTGRPAAKRAPRPGNSSSPPETTA